MHSINEIMHANGFLCLFNAGNRWTNLGKFLLKASSLGVGSSSSAKLDIALFGIRFAYMT